MYKKSFYRFLISVALSMNISNAYATDINADETEKFVPIENKDLGVYIISKVVDSKTNNPIKDVIVKSEYESTNSDQNGEFFIKVSQNGFIVLNYEGYQEKTIKVSDLKGKIKLELIPDYLPLFPNNYISATYRNLGFSESFQGINTTGRIADSFSLDGSIRVLDNLLLTTGYENLGGIYNRNQTSEKQSFNTHTGYLRADWIFSLLKDRVDLALGLKTYYKTLSINNVVTNQDDPRDLDFLDFNNQRLGFAPEIELTTRPLRYIPLVIGANLAYYPYIIISQENNSPLPKNLAGFDYNIYARYDLMKFFIKTQFMSTTSFQDKYNSGNSGLALTLGYSF
ncbi:MAG: hypothetical protein U0354_17965 [Candidatus Sericytochromatia bacterium]